MSRPVEESGAPQEIPSGSGGAALVSAGIGSFALAVLAIVADRSRGFQNWMKFSKPTGPLSGVTTTAIVVWLLCWLVLELRWRNRTVRMKPVALVAFALLALGFLLTFPPVADLF